MSATLPLPGRPWLSSVLLHAALVALVLVGGGLLPDRLPPPAPLDAVVVDDALVAAAAQVRCERRAEARRAARVQEQEALRREREVEATAAAQRAREAEAQAALERQAQEPRGCWRATALRVGNGLEPTTQMGPLANGRRVEAMPATFGSIGMPALR